MNTTSIVTQPLSSKLNGARIATVPRWLTVVLVSGISACAGSVGVDADHLHATDDARRANEVPRNEASNEDHGVDGTEHTPDEANADQSDPSADTSDQPNVESTNTETSDEEQSMSPDTSDATGSSAPTARATLPVHRMTAAEYNNTVSALFGVELTPADAFPAAGTSEFDANVGVLASLSQVSVQGYFNAARDLASMAFADEALRAKIVTCDATQGDELACVREIATVFGRRAFRRPLETAELDRYVNAYTHAQATLEYAPNDALQHMVRSMLSAPSFFLRIELERGQLGEIPTERLAMASRLSYLLWSSTPDDELLTKATEGSLSTAEDVAREVERMLDEPQSAGFYRDFFGQWLGIRALASHNPDADVFPAWSGDVRSAMLDQANAFFSSFVDGSHDFSTFLTASHPANPTLQAFYAGDPEGIRTGFLTLPAFLTASSQADRTSPTARATAVLGGLLCTNIAPPADVDIPDLSAQEGASANDNIRDRLTQHRESPDCATCHAVLDPIGLSLENFDAVGGFRTTYANGSTVDASGEFGGETFQDSQGLVEVLQEEELLATCPPKKLLTYALRRNLTAPDRELAAQIAAQWQSGDFKELVKLVTTSPTFMAVLNAAGDQ